MQPLKIALYTPSRICGNSMHFKWVHLKIHIFNKNKKVYLLTQQIFICERKESQNGCMRH